jgi:hypothetical protein
MQLGRLLILSPFPSIPANARVTAALAQQRNRFVGVLVDRIKDLFDSLPRAPSWG